MFELSFRNDGESGQVRPSPVFVISLGKSILTVTKKIIWLLLRIGDTTKIYSVTQFFLLSRSGPLNFGLSNGEESDVYDRHIRERCL